MEMCGRMAEKDKHVQELHRHLACKEARTCELRGQVTYLERQLHEVKRDPSKVIVELEAAQDQLLQKESDICRIHNMLAGELGKRQEMQCNSLERDRTLSRLQDVLSSSHCLSHRAQSAFQLPKRPEVVTTSSRTPQTSPKCDRLMLSSSSRSTSPVPNSSSSVQSCTESSCSSSGIHSCLHQRVPPTSSHMTSTGAAPKQGLSWLMEPNLDG